MSTLSFHFHGYQPGDIVRWREPDPLRPQTFEQRHSPVVLRIGPDRIEGRNWTDAVLRTYGPMGSVLHRASGSASVDIEPQTLVWLLERDPSAYRAIIAAYDSGTAGFVMTPPFHPILPHLHRQEREALFDLMFDFYSPLIQRAEGRPIGLWLPEAAYSHETMDSVLESLLANPMQAERFESIVQSLREGGVQVAPPVPPRDAPTLALVDHSSWSDYDDMLSGGITSDTRWTGLRRSDGLVVSRIHRDRPMSQLWKHAFTLATERVETAVRRQSLQLLQSAGVTRRPPVLRRLAGSYGRHSFRDHYLAQGLSTSGTDFAASAEDLVGGRMDVEVAGFLARGYMLMLMGTRSDPRFWDNPDTRVTFENVVLLVQALRDLAEASVRAKELGHAATRGRAMRATVLQFT